jgi:hypothetical protein
LELSQELPQLGRLSEQAFDEFQLVAFQLAIGVSAHQFFSYIAHDLNPALHVQPDGERTISPVTSNL